MQQIARLICVIMEGLALTRQIVSTYAYVQKGFMDPFANMVLI